jgi:hypothetical protein
MTTSLSTSTIPVYDPKNSYTSPRPIPRVRPEAQSAYEKSRGSLNISDWHIEGKTYEEKKPQPKIRHEVAEQSYNRNRGCMSELLTGYWEHPALDRKGPRVKREAKQNFAKNQGNMNEVMHQYGRDIPTESHAARAHFEGKDNVEKGRGSMNSLLGNYGCHPLSARPAARVKLQGAEILENNRGSGVDKTFKSLPLSSRPRPTTFFNQKFN